MQNVPKREPYWSDYTRNPSSSSPLEPNRSGNENGGFTMGIGGVGGGVKIH